jgi:hypothetical protein
MRLKRPLSRAGGPRSAKPAVLATSRSKRSCAETGFGFSKDFFNQRLTGPEEKSCIKLQRLRRSGGEIGGAESARPFLRTLLTGFPHSVGMITPALATED